MKNNVMHPEKQSTGNTAWSAGSDAWTGEPKTETTQPTDTSDVGARIMDSASGVLESARDVARSAFDLVAARPVATALAFVGVGAAIFAASKFSGKSAELAATGASKLKARSRKLAKI